MEFKGTKGEWFVDEREQCHNEHGVLVTPISTLNIINFADVYGDDEEAKANALLVSKAPEMLKMLRTLVDKHESHLITSEDIQKVKVLILKATEL
jgi:hypothetical protein